MNQSIKKITNNINKPFNKIKILILFYPLIFYNPSNLLYSMIFIL